MSERIYRDPVHNIIRLETDSDEGALLVQLVDTAEFQRLRRIRQLGLAHFTYQGAEHSRFTHSLGALHLVTRVLEKLSNKYEFSDFDRVTICAAALLHDVGHGAFSHVMENVLGFHHEDLTIQAILAPETEINQVLLTYSADLPRRVADVIAGEFRPMALAQLVSSQLDVDRMDYLLRDSLMTGAKYGIFDLEWIIKTIEIDEKNDRLYVSARGMFAVEDYLQARYYMFRQVYFHRTLRSAEVVLRALLRRALQIFRENGDVWFAPNTAFEKVLRGEKLNLSEHLEIDDADMLFYIKQWQRSSDAILSDLSKRFINRKLFKAFDLDMPHEERAEFLEAARQIIADNGFDADFYCVEDRAGDVPYYSYYSPRAESKNRIYVQDGFSRPQIKEISEVSSAIRGLQQGFEIHRICFPPELKDEITALYHQNLLIKK
ncbi:MAG: HD domain-containing protein [Pyrinomonadaceae bacterium]|nr:HD domain-containing protein [Pyrinomonadaceae bacterium]